MRSGFGGAARDLDALPAPGDPAPEANRKPVRPQSCGKRNQPVCTRNPLPLAPAASN